MDKTYVLGTIMIVAGTITMLAIVDVVLYHFIDPFACFFAVGLEFVALGKTLISD